MINTEIVNGVQDIVRSILGVKSQNADIVLHKGNIIFRTILSIDNNDNINKENIKPETTEKEQNNSNKSDIIPVNQNKLKYIKFLICLHFLQESLNYKINESLLDHSFEDKYYLIKKTR